MVELRHGGLRRPLEEQCKDSAAEATLVFLIGSARCWDIKGALILLFKTANCVPRRPLSHGT